MNPEELVEVALKIWPLVEKALALRQANPSITEEEARAVLTQHVAALQAKIQADLDAHPPPAAA